MRKRMQRRLRLSKCLCTGPSLRSTEPDSSEHEYNNNDAGNKYTNSSSVDRRIQWLWKFGDRDRDSSQQIEQWSRSHGLKDRRDVWPWNIGCRDILGSCNHVLSIHDIELCVSAIP